ncbi:hypothetical protein GLOIN_2v1814576 [Rhizophagus clarus]|uniref:Uncharacterized protein n=1 Tax=Rhizophagus clarus TaxID=94130 RepID=A0A8H3MA78_9GLOM|nr:hypothetical protein GLOIN_2v1814576 [Rhizophagus clarus]
MLCRHQYRVLLQSSKAMFHIAFINNCASVSLHYIEYINPTNVHMPAIREKVNKKIQFGTALSLAKISIQIVVSEGVITEFIGILMQFNMKYRCNTGFGLEETCDLSSKT